MKFTKKSEPIISDKHVYVIGAVHSAYVGDESIGGIAACHREPDIVKSEIKGLRAGEIGV